MPRRISKLAPGWWDYTTLDQEILDDAARLDARDLQQHPAKHQVGNAHAEHVAAL